MGGARGGGSSQALARSGGDPEHRAGAQQCVQHVNPTAFLTGATASASEALAPPLPLPLIQPPCLSHVGFNTSTPCIPLECFLTPGYSLSICAQGLQDPHAKVRWAACQAVGQMCTDLGPDIQNNEHATIVPALTEVMKDFNEPRVQAHAAAAIVNFSENCDEAILTGYLDALITQLLGLLQTGQKLVKVG